MLELGRQALPLHREVGQFAAALKFTKLIVCGDLGREIAVGAREAGMSDQAIAQFPDASSAADLLKKTVRQGDVVLVKASRGMKMEHVVQGLTGMKAVTRQAS
jgi:UDP-N-acetylmuramoyl-tripeptide--D-alanyl-D-alanine ligase